MGLTVVGWRGHQSRQLAVGSRKSLRFPPQSMMRSVNTPNGFFSATVFLNTAIANLSNIGTVVYCRNSGGGPPHSTTLARHPMTTGSGEAFWRCTSLRELCHRQGTSRIRRFNAQHSMIRKVRARRSLAPPWRTESVRATPAYPQISTVASQPLAPNCDLNFSARFSAAARFSAMAKVVDPLPDMSAISAPFSIRNSR